MRFLTVCLGGLLLGACNFQQQADQQFGDQHVKTSIALIELHKTRYGDYPNALSDLRFIGDWDRIALDSVEYEKLGDGYALKVTQGWTGKPELNYPAKFWRGLGIRKFNGEARYTQ